MVLTICCPAARIGGMAQHSTAPPQPGRRRRNLDPAEVERFERLASEWWDANGKLRPLHKPGPRPAAVSSATRSSATSSARRRS